MQRGTLFHRRRMESHERRREAAGAYELPHCLPGRDHGQLVPEARHRAGQRRGSRRRVGARRIPCGAEKNETVVLARVGLRTTTARRARQRGLDRLAQGNTAQLDRPERGHRSGIQRQRQRPYVHHLHHTRRHNVRRNIHGARTRKRTR